MARVEIRNLTKSWGDLVAVNDVSYEVQDGEFMCMLGPSGCGKTTTLRCIAGLEAPDAGEIYIGDRLVNDVPPRERDVAMVFQFYAMFPGMKAFDQIAFPLSVKHVPKSEINTRVKEVAELLKISDILSKPVSGLTADQKQRIALGRAIIRRPSCFLLDEPLTNLDATLRARMRGELGSLMREIKGTVVYVTHDQIEAMALADRIAVMDKGKILQYGNPEAIYGHPTNLFVASFIGSPSMNFIDCTLMEEDGGYFIETEVFKLSISAELAEMIKKEATSTELLLGIRPEHFSVTRKGAREAIKAKIITMERSGSRCLYYLTVEGYELIANAVPLDVGVGDGVFLVPNKDMMHVFDKRTEKCIF